VSKDALDKAADAIKRTTDDVKDTLHEGQHRSAAEAERMRRKSLHGELTGAEKMKSALNEAKERAQAEFDAAKREARKHS